ncbi:hypothetical protein NG99_01230 [Erwinia typographi]|uniref:Uncharacterized protein n=1 Tax=Erwinia typographi TaxID=371042 RepID=A0A0A4AD70_9GAMM|nr:hypothetical protein [Erwinia typographi]KGT95793.1 hypothetical protein NG99_01230 [Erwinia typographi]
MKTKRKSFEQFLWHDINIDIEDDAEKQEEYLKSALPLVGQIVMYFNALEKELDKFIYECISDRSDQLGIIIVHNMNYASKVELFKRYSELFHLNFGEYVDMFEALIKDLKECGRLRNITVHADWDSTDAEGYTYLGIKITNNGISQEYIQFDLNSLNNILDLIFSTRHKLSDYSKIREGILSSY